MAATSVQPVSLPHADSGAYHLRYMRAMLGKCAIASAYDRMSDAQKMMVLYGAKLSPHHYLRTAFNAFDDEQREQLRVTLIQLLDIAQLFKGKPIGRGDVIPLKRPVAKPLKSPESPFHYSSPKTLICQGHNDDLLADVSSVAAELAAEKALPHRRGYAKY